MFDIGSSLREARLRQNLDFPELEERTKIRPKYLRALEDERFDILPAPTYVRGFLRSYAEALGLDGQPFVDEYNSRFTVGEDDAPLRARRAPLPRRDRGPRESRMAAVALVAIAVATALVIAAWRFGGPESEKVPGLVTQGPGTTSQAANAKGKVHMVVRAVDGSSWMEVRTAIACREAPVLGHPRARAAEAVRRALPPARPRGAGRRGRPRERQSRRPAGWDDVRRHRTEDHPGHLLTRPRAAIVVTGSELVRGERQDRNGPFLAAEAVRLGLDSVRIAIVGDRIEDLEAAFAQGFSADLCLVSGGLGPDARRSHRRARGARRRSSARPRRGARAPDRGHLARDRGAPRPPVRGVHDRRAQAGDPARGRDLARPGRNRARCRPRHGTVCRRRAARPAARAPDGSGRARSRRSRCGESSSARPRESTACCASSERRSRP